MTFKPLAILSLFCATVIAAEIHPQLKQAAESYDRAIKGFETSVTAQTKIAKDGYLAVLEAAKKREAAAKRPAGVTAIEAEVTAVNAGSTAESEQFPADLKTHRDRYIAATKRAMTSNDSVRKNATDEYLKYLGGLEKIARGKDEALVAAIVAERNRVNAAAPKEANGAK